MAGRLGPIPPSRAAAFKGRKRGGARRSPYDRLRGRPPRRPLDIVSPLACALLRTPAHVLDANVSRPAARWPPYIAADRRSAPIGDPQDAAADPLCCGLWTCCATWERGEPRHVGSPPPCGGHGGRLMGAPADGLSCDVVDRSLPPGIRALASGPSAPLPPGRGSAPALSAWWDAPELFFTAGRDLAGAR